MWPNVNLRKCNAHFKKGMYILLKKDLKNETSTLEVLSWPFVDNNNNNNNISQFRRGQTNFS